MSNNDLHIGIDWARPGSSDKTALSIRLGNECFIIPSPFAEAVAHYFAPATAVPESTDQPDDLPELYDIFVVKGGFMQPFAPEKVATVLSEAEANRVVAEYQKTMTSVYHLKRLPKRESIEQPYSGPERRDQNTETIPLQGKRFYQPNDSSRMKLDRRKEL